MISCSSKMRKSNSKIENQQSQVAQTSAQSSSTVNLINSNSSTSIFGDEMTNQLKSIELPSTTTVDTSNKCSAKFEKIISNLPDALKTIVINEFKANTNKATCCDSDSLIKSVAKALREYQKKFTKLMSDQSSKAKQGLTCVRAPDVVQSKMKQTPDSIGTSQQKTIIDQLLSNANRINSSLAKCLVQINKIVIKNLGLMCGDDSFIQAFWNSDSNGKVTSPKKSQENEMDLYNNCNDYIKNYSNFAGSVLTSYTDSLNFLLGNERCNYFSNNFKFDMTADKEDPLFPTAVKNSPKDSASELLNTWYENVKKVDGVKENLVTQLKRDFVIAQQRQPNGLGTYIGRYDINYDLIKKTFYLNKHPSFHIQCRTKKCIAYCPNCSGLSWDSDKVVSNDTTNLDVSCANNVCVVLVSIFDYISGSQTVVPGAEIFLVRGSDNLKEVDNLTVTKLRNAAKCFAPSSKPATSFSQISQNTNTASNANPTTNSTISSPPAYVEAKSGFNDAAFKNNLVSIVKDPTQYEQDFNLATALKLKVTVSGTAKTLEDYIYNTLYKTNYSFYMACEKGLCAVQCDSCDKTPLTLTPNTDTNLEDPLNNKGDVAARKSGGRSGSSSRSGSSKSSSSGSSKSSSSGSSSKSGSSSGSSSKSGSSSGSSSKSGSSSGSSSKSGSSSNGGSTSTGGSTSSSSKGGSALTSSTSSTSKGGSALTAGSSSKTPSTTNTSSYVSSNKSPVNSSFTKSHTTIVNNNYSSSSSTKIINVQSTTHKTYYTYNVNTYQPTTKVKVKIYDYTPSYAGSYSYYPYSYYGGLFYYPRYSYYRSYGVYGYDPYYYRPPNPYVTNNKYNNRIYLQNEFNPSDWSPASSAPLTKVDYMKIINTQLQNVKIYVECCKLFCVTYVDSIQDGLPNKNNKKRTYIDITLRGFAFINSSNLTLPQGKCLIKNTLAAYSTPSSSSAASQGLYSKCGLPEPFDIFPIKKNCAYNMVSYCAKNNFPQLVNRVAALVTSSDEKGAACSAPLSCINMPDSPSDAQKRSCGDAIYSLFIDSGAKINYSTLAIPCSKSETTPSAFIQKTMIRQNSNTSAYVNVNSLSPAQKQAYNSVSTKVNANPDTSVVIDNSSPSSTYSSVDESKNINSSADVVVQASVSNSGNLIKFSFSIIFVFALMLF